MAGVSGRLNLEYAFPPRLRALADGIYVERAFDRMPFLADALEASGCADADLIEHCLAVAGSWICCWTRAEPWEEDTSS